MKQRFASALGPAALLLVVVGLAMWVVSQLVGAQAGAERLPLVFVGQEAAPSGTDPSRQAAGDPAAATDATTGPAQMGVGPGATSSGPGGDSGGPSAGATGQDFVASVTTATTLGPRLVVPDAMREHDGDHDGTGPPTHGSASGMGGTPDTMAH